MSKTVAQQVKSRVNWTHPVVTITPRDSVLRNLAGVYKGSKFPTIHTDSAEYKYLFDYFVATELSLYPEFCQKYSPGYYEYYGYRLNEIKTQAEESARAAIIEVARTGLFGRTKIGKVLRRINPALDASKLYTPGKEVEFVISVRYNDILRCSFTKHFSSCFRLDGINRQVPAHYLENPGIAIAFVRDSSGKFASRMFLHLADDGSIISGRPYGDLIAEDWQLLFNQNKIPYYRAFLSCDPYHDENNITVVRSKHILPGGDYYDIIVKQVYHELNKSNKARPDPTEYSIPLRAVKYSTVRVFIRNADTTK